MLTDSLEVPQGALETTSKPLVRLEVEIRRVAGDDADPAVDAARTLRRVAHIRTGQQHAAAAKQVDRDWVALGLPRCGSDWPGAWHQICVVTVEALTTIRETIMSVVDAKA